ncbi:hypothetical protein A2U01_0079213, partial [Trifolium medium]|nr:hypothetical protein [Trifolium medium]
MGRGLNPGHHTYSPYKGGISNHYATVIRKFVRRIREATDGFELRQSSNKSKLRATQHKLRVMHPVKVRE